MNEKKKVIPNPYSKKSTVIEIKEFISIDKLSKMQKVGKRQKARIFCKTCNRHHHLHWGEFKNALKEDPNSLQDIIDIYSWKYCEGE